MTEQDRELLTACADDELSDTETVAVFILLAENAEARAFYAAIRAVKADAQRWQLTDTNNTMPQLQQELNELRDEIAALRRDLRTLRREQAPNAPRRYSIPSTVPTSLS